jgi:hypothetical protein
VGSCPPPGGDDDTLGYLVEHFEFLKLFIAQAAERRLGMLVYIN